MDDTTILIIGLILIVSGIVFSLWWVSRGTFKKEWPRKSKEQLRERIAWRKKFGRSVLRHEGLTDELLQEGEDAGIPADEIRTYRNMVKGNRFKPMAPGTFVKIVDGRPLPPMKYTHKDRSESPAAVPPPEPTVDRTSETSEPLEQPLLPPISETSLAEMLPPEES